MYKWLDRQLDGRSVAEMSILHTISGVCSLILFGLCSYQFESAIPFLVFMSVWFLCHVWLWIGLVIIAWKADAERLGVEVFRYLQIGILVMTAIITLPSIRSVDDFKLYFFMILAFDIVIAWMTIHFLFLAWFARCTIPLRTYCEIGSIIGMVVIQIWLFA